MREKTAVHDLTLSECFSVETLLHTVHAAQTYRQSPVDGLTVAGWKMLAYYASLMLIHMTLVWSNLGMSISTGVGAGQNIDMSCYDL